MEDFRYSLEQASEKIDALSVRSSNPNVTREEISRELKEIISRTSQVDMIEP